MISIYRRQFFVGLLCLLSIFHAQTCLENLDVAKKRVEAYYENGSYDKELNTVVNRAINYFSRVPVHKNSTIVFDIDDTALSTFAIAKAVHYGHVEFLTVEADMGGRLPAIRGTKRLYDYLISRGFHIIFITGRTEFEQEPTKQNLINQGYATFDRLIMRNPQEVSLTARVYKSAVRAQLAKEGYNIVGDVGDQWSDLLGGNAGHQVKLPNYLYTLK